LFRSQRGLSLSQCLESVDERNRCITGPRIFLWWWFCSRRWLRAALRRCEYGKKRHRRGDCKLSAWTLWIFCASRVKQGKFVQRFRKLGVTGPGAGVEVG